MENDMRNPGPPEATGYSQQAFMSSVSRAAEKTAELFNDPDVTPDRILIELTANLLTFVLISGDDVMIQAVGEKAQSQAAQIVERRRRAEQAQIEANMDLAAKLGGGWGGCVTTLSTRAVVCTINLLKQSDEIIALLRPLPDEDDLAWMSRVRDWCDERPYYHWPRGYGPDVN